MEEEGEARMTELSDIHNHTLFGLDDGAAELSDSMQMLALSYQEGVRCLCMTPHCNPAMFPAATVEAAKEKFARVCEAASSRFPGLELALGNEFFALTEDVELIRAGQCLTLGGGRTVLVEFSPDASYRMMANTMRAIHAMGKIPLLAHAERYDCLVRDPGRVEELRRMRVHIQVNARTVTGSILFPASRFVRSLLRERWVDVVASDAHDAKHRPPFLQAAHRVVRKLCGRAYAEEIFCINPHDMANFK